MFVVRDWTRNPSYTMVSNDVKDVRDIVIGITGDETIGDHVLLHLGHMFDTNILPGNEYFVGGYYTRIKTHVEDYITVIDSGRLVSMSIVPEHNVADENLKVRRVGPNAEN